MKLGSIADLRQPAAVILDEAVIADVDGGDIVGSATSKGVLIPWDRSPHHAGHAGAAVLR